MLVGEEPVGDVDDVDAFVIIFRLVGARDEIAGIAVFEIAKRSEFAFEGFRII